jgi:hypothetical protein
MTTRQLAVVLALLPLAGACRPADAPPKPSAANPATASGSPAASGRDTAANEPPVAAMAMHCFENRLPDGSVVSFHYAHTGERVVGILDYAFVQKDSAHGTFRGRLDGGTITALWAHTVEGSDQVQEVLVRVEGDRALKANGELTEGRDRVQRLKDPAAAAFNESFTRVRCD